MPRPLGLHHLTLKELDPFAFVEVAAASGYDAVSLFTNAPHVPQEGREGMFVFPTVMPGMAADMRRRLDDLGLAMNGAEFFLMTPDADLESYVPGLATGAALGAAHAVTHVFDTERQRGADTLGRFCELAAREGLTVGIEFCQMTPGCKAIGDAAWYVDQVGAANLAFGICPMHLIRSGGSAADIARLGPRYLAYGQINDGKGLHMSAEYFAEVHDRELPGDGDFPLHDILSALPESVPLEVKIPYERRHTTGMTARELACTAHDRARRILDNLAPASG